MGKFDGVLICSDFDGTIFNGKVVPEDTKKAIEYFMSEGGKFCICSGRGPEFLREMSPMIKGNTYSICHGGAIITNIWTEETLKDEFVDKDAFDIVDELLCCGAETTRINIMRKDGIIDRYSPEEYKENRNNISPEAYKITLNGNTDEDGQLYVEFARHQMLLRVVICVYRTNKHRLTPCQQPR